MKKHELRNGMVVEQRNGDRKLVVGDLLIGEDDWGVLDEHRDDLISKDSEYDIDFEEFDIVKVYEVIYNIGTLRRLLSKNNFSNLRESDCIWTRDDIKKSDTSDNKTVIETIKDVANGMIVETRQGSRYIILDNLLIGENGWLELSDYNNSVGFNHRSFKDFDIVKIYSPDEELGEQRLPKNNFSNLSEEFLVWSRVDEETKAEAECILGLLSSSIDSLSKEELEAIIKLGEK